MHILYIVSYLLNCQIQNLSWEVIFELRSANDDFGYFNFSLKCVGWILQLCEYELQKVGILNVEFDE